MPTSQLLLPSRVWLTASLIHGALAAIRSSSAFASAMTCFAPSTLLIDGLAPFNIGGQPNEHLYLRVYNDDPSFAPAGHTVVQAMLAIDYTWWATRGTRYGSEKDAVAATVRAQLEPHFPGIRSARA